jgi:anti-sigma-K factor RskA
MARGPSEETLQAYHDGELGFFARRRVERQIAGSPEARETLESLALVGELVRESQATGPAPDLWADIARELPARPIEAAGPVAETARPSWVDAVAWLFRPAPAAVAAVAAAAVAIFVWSGNESATGMDVVQYLDPGDNSVMLLQGQDDATIIWVMEPATDTSSSSRESRAVI